MWWLDRSAKYFVDDFIKYSYTGHYNDDKKVNTQSFDISDSVYFLLEPNMCRIGIKLY